MLFERSIIFQPKKLPSDFIFESKFPLTEYFYDFEIEGKNYSINAVHLKSNESKGFVFFLHGTLAHIQYHIPRIDFCVENNYDVFIMDYPGYGKSKGKPSEKILHQLVEATFHKAMEEWSPSNLIIIGRSLGTALAAHLAEKINPRKLVLVSPYYNMPDLFNHHAKFFSFNLNFKFENDVYLPRVKSDAYIFHGDKDKLIPISLAKKLIPHLKDQSNFIEITGADHFNIHQMPAYRERLTAILA